MKGGVPQDLQNVGVTEGPPALQTEEFHIRFKPILSKDFNKLTCNKN